MRTKPSAQSIDRGVGLIGLSWAASIGALGFYFWAVMGWGMSATSSPHASFGELLMLAAGPLVSAACLFHVVTRCKITLGRFALMLFPALLTLAEFAFIYIMWKAG